MNSFFFVCSLRRSSACLLRSDPLPWLRASSCFGRALARCPCSCLLSGGCAPACLSAHQHGGGCRSRPETTGPWAAGWCGARLPPFFRRLLGTCARTHRASLCMVVCMAPAFCAGCGWLAGAVRCTAPRLLAALLAGCGRVSSCLAVSLSLGWFSPSWCCALAYLSSLPGFLTLRAAGRLACLPKRTKFLLLLPPHLSRPAAAAHQRLAGSCLAGALRSFCPPFLLKVLSYNQRHSKNFKPRPGLAQLLLPPPALFAPLVVRPPHRGLAGAGVGAAPSSSTASCRPP